MRLTSTQIAVIKQAATQHFGPESRVRLFGSRTDDNQRGGDIDLYIETTQQNIDAIVRAEIAFLANLHRQLGEQKIDVLIDYPTRKSHPPIFTVAKQTGLLL